MIEGHIESIDRDRIVLNGHFRPGDTLRLPCGATRRYVLLSAEEYDPEPPEPDYDDWSGCPNCEDKDDDITALQDEVVQLEEEVDGLRDEVARLEGQLEGLTN